jgi:hypothetical protein
MLDETDAECDQRRLVEWIQRRGGAATAREVQQGCRWLKGPGAAETALEELVKAGRGSWQPAPSLATGGRPSRVFALFRSSTVYETPSKPEENAGFVDVDGVDSPETEAPAPEAPADFFQDTTPSGPYEERL